MTDNRTTELREKLAERGVDYRTTEVHGMTVTLYDSGGRTWSVTDHPNGYLVVNCVNFTPEQAIAATLGSDRDEIYSAGFDNGVKACLQILDGYLEYPHSAAENIQKWVDEQWEEYGA